MPSSATASCLRHEVARRANRMRRSELAVRMGYPRVNEKLLSRFDAVLNDDLLGLDDSGFDFRYSRDEFLVALCDVLDIDPALRKAEHERIRALVSHRATAFRPRIFVNTGFKRASQPIFALAAMEHRRWLCFERAFVDLDLADQFRAARERVIAHYDETDGELDLWGTIQRYLFQYADDAVLIFDTAGRAVGETDAICAGRAAATIGGRNVSGVVSVSDQTKAEPTDDSHCPPDRPH